MSKFSPNDETVEAYNHTIKWYLKYTPRNYNKTHAPLLNWINTSLDLIPKDSRIFEIGSGPGRDARYIMQKGYDVTCSDASFAFVEYLNKKRHTAVQFNAIKDPLEGTYSMVFANAVVPHFTESDLRLVLEKVHRTLDHGGIFAFSAKQGNGEIWTREKIGDKRYIRYWQPEELKVILEKSGYQVVFLDHGIPGDLPTHTWILLTARKITAGDQ